MRKSTKIIWSGVLIYSVIMVLLGLLGAPLGLLMAENLANVLLIAVVLQLLFRAFNKGTA